MDESSQRPPLSRHRERPPLIMTPITVKCVFAHLPLINDCSSYGTYIQMPPITFRAFLRSGHVKVAGAVLLCAIPVLGLQGFNGWLAGKARPLIIAARETILEREDTQLRRLQGERPLPRGPENMFELGRRLRAEAEAEAGQGQQKPAA